MKIIGVDLDNTMFTFRSLMYGLMNKFQPIKSSTGNFAEFSGGNHKKANFLLKKLHKVFNPAKYHTYPRAIETINFLRSIGFKVYFISSRPNISPIINVTFEWLDKNDIKYDKVVLGCRNKAIYAKEKNVDLMIDDYFATCQQLDKVGIRSILFKGSLKDDEGQYKLLKYPNIALATSWLSIAQNVDHIFEDEFEDVDFISREEIKRVFKSGAYSNQFDGGGQEQLSFDELIPIEHKI